MEYLPSQKWADLATKEDLRLLAKELTVDMQAGFARMEAKFAQIDGQFAQVKSQFAQVDSRFAEMESKFAQQTRTIVLALGGFAATIWGSMLATALIVA